MAVNVAMIEGMDGGLGGLRNQCLLMAESKDPKKAAVGANRWCVIQGGGRRMMARRGKACLRYGTNKNGKNVCLEYGSAKIGRAGDLVPVVSYAKGREIGKARKENTSVARRLRSRHIGLPATYNTYGLIAPRAVEAVISNALTPGRSLTAGALKQIANKGSAGAMAWGATQKSARATRHGTTKWTSVGRGPVKKLLRGWDKKRAQKAYGEKGAKARVASKKVRKTVTARPATATPITPVRVRKPRVTRKVEGFYGLGDYGYKAGRCFNLSTNRFAKTSLCGGGRAKFSGMDDVSDDVALDLGGSMEQVHSPAVGRDLAFYTPKANMGSYDGLGLFGSGFGAFGGIGYMPLIGVGVGGLGAGLGAFLVRKLFATTTDATTKAVTITSPKLHKLAGLVGVGIGAALAGVMYLFNATKSAVFPAAVSAAVVGLIDVAQNYLFGAKDIPTQGLGAIVSDQQIRGLSAIVADQQVQGLEQAPGVQVLQGNDNEITVLPMAFGAVPLSGY